MPHERWPVDENQGFPALRHVVLDTTDARALAEFYRQLLGLSTGREMSLRRPAIRTR
jgi:catechol-2,3-dioxygenase